jgi:hypothetical protein
MSGKGKLLKKVTTGMSFNPDEDEEVLKHLKETTKFNLVDGVMRRTNQAITKPKDYLDDKSALWHSFIAGSKGDTERFKVKLPGANDDFIPAMSPLVTEWRTTYNALVCAGIPNDTAALQADSYCNSIFNERIKMFDTAFPGLVDDAYKASLSNKVAENNANALGAGLIDVPSSSTYKFEKYRKRAKKYKAKKRATKST